MTAAVRNQKFHQRRPLWVHVLAFSLLWITLGAMAQQTALTTLAALRSRYRPLLIFAPRPDDPQLEIQTRTLQEHAAAVEDRDLAVIALPYETPSPSRLQLSPAEADATRRLFHINPDEFTVLLLGKDGGLKLRSRKPVSLQTLIETIDAMPMRQDEIKAKIKAEQKSEVKSEVKSEAKSKDQP